MRTILILGFTVVWCTSASAEVASPRLLLDAATAYSSRSDRQDGGSIPVRSSGGALSYGRVSGAGYGKGHFGGWLALSMDRFALNQEGSAAATASGLTATGANLAAAF